MNLDELLEYCKQNNLNIDIKWKRTFPYLVGRPGELSYYGMTLEESVKKHIKER